MDLYKTIAKASEGFLTEQRSKFIAHAFPVHTQEEAKERVDACRKRYYDARHVCWAYMIGHERTDFRVNDDGEPSSTAGKPILGVIHSNDLTDILIVVIRYFGGVKLGTGGLIVAYRTAAQDAIRNAEIIQKTVDQDITVTFEYPFLNRIMRIVKEDNLLIVAQRFDLDCEITLRIRQSEVEKLQSRLLKVETARIN